jgi:hypothetical protein
MRRSEPVEVSHRAASGPKVAVFVHRLPTLPCYRTCLILPALDCLAKKRSLMLAEVRGERYRCTRTRRECTFRV